MEIRYEKKYNKYTSMVLNVPNSGGEIVHFLIAKPEFIFLPVT